MEEDLLDALGRNSRRCTHKLRDFQKCNICNVILFDRPMDTLGEMPWHNLLIASPRMKEPSQDEIANIIKRFNGENALIELDAKTKFKKQSDYVEAHFAQSTKVHALNKRTKEGLSIAFKDNLRTARESLFPKVSIPPSPEKDAVESSTHNLFSTYVIKIYPPPYSGHAIELTIQSTVTAADLVRLIVRERRLAESHNWRLRWVEDDESSPDFDLPALEDNQVVAELNTTELCLSDG